MVTNGLTESISLRYENTSNYRIFSAHRHVGDDNGFVQPDEREPARA
jgi:hypothetical protein